ncbi:hypothetical protein [Aquamicrobium zhengzhouense]|uniref:Uncharacterized protein n=1 Tax=Aquamicrobium zhengzhouense TaxID=2781738 RepID=A0ABS0SIB3_9HYPH|nr:hypothetical protein [Aquamicrobium zhengzhouense]MBI1622238.1 hypothetical protein [Aquamicrobium zhengzhouense]
MRRVPTVLAMMAMGVTLSASPLASATGGDEPEAQSADMLAMAMCGDRKQVLSDLQQQFSEAPMAIGQVDEQAVMEILVSESGSWTILATGTDGVSCIVSAGEGFQSTTLVRGVDI